MSTKPKTAYFEWLRLFAAAAVVLMHTAAKRWLSISHTVPEWEVLTLWDSLVRWPVPIFIMITGALFLPRKTELKTALGRYIPRMAVCFLVWAGVYALYAGELTLNGLVSGYYHLWYLPFLCGVYLTLPFLQRIAEDDRLADQLLAVSLTVGTLFPWLVKLGELLLPEHSGLLTTLAGLVNYTFFFDHISLLLLGHRLHRTELSRKQRRVIYILGLLGVSVTGIATIWATSLTDFQNSLFFDIAAPNNLCAAAALFVFAKQHLRSLPKWVAVPAKHSFGIYLVHALVIDLLADRGYHVLTWDPVWSVPVLSAAVFAISLTLAALLRRIPLIGKWIV
jgi:surface polysaccharide O-acyltransferase-like enzyme